LKGRQLTVLKALDKKSAHDKEKEKTKIEDRDHRNLYLAKVHLSPPPNFVNALLMFFFFINVGVRASLRAPRLIPRALKLIFFFYWSQMLNRKALFLRGLQLLKVSQLVIWLRGTGKFLSLLFFIFPFYLCLEMKMEATIP
jgi:hypothetical protein